MRLLRIRLTFSVSKSWTLEGEFQTIDLKINEFNEIVGDCQCDGFNGPVSTCTSIYLSNLPLHTRLSENIQ